MGLDSVRTVTNSAKKPVVLHLDVIGHEVTIPPGKGEVVVGTFSVVEGPAKSLKVREA